MAQLLDISMNLHDAMPVWPGSPGVRCTRRMSLDAGDNANVSQLDLDVHTGTHIDAPLHFLPAGGDVAAVGLEPFVGAAQVACTGRAEAIDADALDRLGVPSKTERLLLKTLNSDRPERGHLPFDEQFAALTVSGAAWIADRRFKLVGIDYLSIQRYDEPDAVHHVILDAGTCILEGLVLDSVAPGPYELICLPLRLSNCEAAPARAVLRPTSHL